MENSEKTTVVITGGVNGNKVIMDNLSKQAVKIGFSWLVEYDSKEEAENDLIECAELINREEEDMWGKPPVLINSDGTSLSYDASKAYIVFNDFR